MDVLPYQIFVMGELCLGERLFSDTAECALHRLTWAMMSRLTLPLASILILSPDLILFLAGLLSASLSSASPHKQHHKSQCTSFNALFSLLFINSNAWKPFNVTINILFKKSNVCLLYEIKMFLKMETFVVRPTAVKLLEFLQTLHTEFTEFSRLTCVLCLMVKSKINWITLSLLSFFFKSPITLLIGPKIFKVKGLISVIHIMCCFREHVHKFCCLKLVNMFKERYKITCDWTYIIFGDRKHF